MHNIPDFLRITPEMQSHFANGGYIVKRSHERKGKTHVVIGPDGTKKYFGDSKLGQHPNDPARKKAFYARHKHNLEHNPYFRAFARATWADGGYIPEYQDGTAAVDLAEVKISPKEYKELSNEELRALHNKVGRPESSDRSNTLPRIIKDSLHNAGAIKRLRNAITNSTGATNTIVGPSTQYEGNNGQYYALTPREAEQYNQYESNLPWYKNLWYNVATRDIPEGSRLANYEQRQGAYMNNFPYVYTDTNGEATQLNTPVVYKGKTYTTPFIVNPEEEGSIYYSDGTVAPSNRPNTNNSTQVNPQWIAQMQQQGFKHGGSYGPFYNRRDAAKMQRWRTPNANSMSPSFFAMGGLNQYPDGGPLQATANTGQGINTTVADQTPAVAQTSTNNQPFGMMAPQPTPQAPSPLTNESLTSYLQSNTPEASASRQNTEDYNAQQAMQKDFGKSMDEVDMAYKDIATAHPNYTNEEILKTLRTNYQDELNKKNADLKNQADKAEQARMKSIAGTMHGASQAFDAGLAGLDLLSRMNPNSSQMAVLNKNRENANPMNTMNIVGNRKGIEYAAHGGYTGLKEGVELNLTTQQIHELEKQGYKFQIL
jgi:hypothetical protein